MELIIIGLVAAVIVSALAGLTRETPPPPPQFVVVQTPPPPQSGTGCLPLLILFAVILAAFFVT